MNLLALIEEKGSITMEDATKVCGGDDDEVGAKLIRLYREHKVVLIQGETGNLIMSTAAFGQMLVEMRDALEVP